MRGDEHALPIQHGRQDVLAIIGKGARDRVLEALAAGRRDVVAAPPDLHLLLAPALTGIILVEAVEIAVVALVERLVGARRQSRLAALFHAHPPRVLRPAQRPAQPALAP